MKQEDRLEEIYSNTSKSFTTEKDYIPLSVITVLRNMRK